MMALKITCLTLLLWAGPALAHQSEEAEPGRRAHSPIEHYRITQVQGWTLRVHQDLIADDTLHEQVVGEIDHQLFRITRMLPADKVEQMQKVVIWVELSNPNSSAGQYHPSDRWLANNGYLVEKEKCVEISDARNFLRTTRTTQPCVLLHELAHAYHHQVLGYDHEKVVAAYRAAVESGKYDRVQHIGGRTVKAYAMTNEKEYFSELTECYLGTNDFFPFVRVELQHHDPQGYELMREIWGPIR